MKSLFNDLVSLSPLMLVLCLLGGGCQQDRLLSDSGPKLLREEAQQWDLLFNTRDTAKLASLYADDAVSMPPGMPTVRGRAAIQAELDTLFESNNATHETLVDEILVGDGWAIERARYAMTFQPKDGSPPTRETGRHVMCRRKTDGRWLIAWEIWNADVPAEQP